MTKEQLKYDFRLNHGTVSFSNPISLYFSLCGFGGGECKQRNNCRIDCGIESICSFFRLGDNMQTIDSDSGNERVAVRIPDVGDNVAIMQRAFEFCCYELVAMSVVDRTEDVKWIMLQFESSR